MVSLTLINALDQPTGRRRLLAELITGIQDKNFSHFRLIVAYAKSGPLLRMQSVIEASRAKGLKIEAIFGLDQQGTSAQALAFALQHFDNVYVTREPNLTFHPKMYAFEGPHCARLFIGSNNLTVGGTERNFETALNVDMELPKDAATLQLFTNCWKELLPASCKATQQLTASLLSEYLGDGTVLDEIAIRIGRGGGSTGPVGPTPPRSGLKTKPASPLPPRKAVEAAAVPTVTPKVVAGSVKIAIDPYTAQGLAIQIKPHHNGEIFLSVTAALQNPAFFKWPFTGLTVPKKASNPAYPQLTPDPRVNIVVYGAKTAPLLALTDYGLNTIYYSKKSEIRITASPLVGVVPDYSVMIMQQSEMPGIDYDITIHTPASPDFGPWLAACNQKMPGGGAAPRKFGWF
ncbi:MAG TPA: phospholipase D family protein [Bradyrhizobium sp.]|jgi:HKD family nuclease|nr:phospholipase D family protein [Bradyrhizobium sp.]